MDVEMNRFEVDGTPSEYNGFVGIRGSALPLRWDSTIFMKTGHVNLAFPSSLEDLEYKFVIDTKDTLIWENIQNRVANVKTQKLLSCKWN